MVRNDVTPEPFELTGGALCLDFANTLGDRPHGESEHLRGFDDLLRWANETDVVEEVGLARLRREASRQASRARAAFRSAVRLREAIYRIFSARFDGRLPAQEDLSELNRHLASAFRHLRLEADRDGFGWTWDAPETRLDRLLWPIARSAAELLTSPDVADVRECASDRCSWLFLDRSRTRRRRWCDMKVCGNRAKARRHYERTKKNAGSAGSS